MSTLKRRLVAVAAAVLATLPTTMLAGPLTIADVSSGVVTCLFDPTCIVKVSDTDGAIALPNLLQPGTVVLQSRTFAGAPGTPGAGLTVYEYRVDMAQAAGNSECLGGLVLNFGPVKELPYKSGSLAHMYVITTGGIGTIGVKSAEQDGDVITLDFDKLLCVGSTPSAANTTFFFGLAATAPPVATSAGVYAIGSPPYFAVPARAPKH